MLVSSFWGGKYFIFNFLFQTHAKVDTEMMSPIYSLPNLNNHHISAIPVTGIFSCKL